MDKTIEHSNRAHALLSASGASRWLACPPSAVAGEKATGGERKTSVFAEEGTFAHELSELYFARKYQGMHGRTFNARLKEMQESEYYNDELNEYVLQYVDYVDERVNAARARADSEPMLMFEEQLDFSKYVPEGFGTGDVLIYNGGEAEIIDLKFGRGVEVSAEHNPQLMLYGLGALEYFSIFEDVETVSMTIHQPRLNNISVFHLDAKELTSWGESIRPTAQLAFKGEGEFNPGEHCRFCPIKAVCRARMEKSTAKLGELKEPYLISHDELTDLLHEVDDIEKWAKDVKSYAFEKALNGVTFDGFKLVEGRSVRRYTNEAEIIHTLHESGIDDEMIFQEPKIKTITNLEKAIGKKTVAELIGAYIEKPEGKPTLVPSSDKRPELNSADDDFTEIN